MHRVLIIGAGINGLCLAMQLIEKGYLVEVVDKGRIPNIFAASSLEKQIVRPQYGESSGFGLRVQGALQAWRNVFEKLEKNYYLPMGVVSVSFHPDDWTERTMTTMRENHLPFRHISASRLRDMMPGLIVENARNGLLADFGGVIYAEQMIEKMVAYLKEKDVKFRANTDVLEIASQAAKIAGSQEKIAFDWCIVTSGLSELLPESFSGVKRFRAYYADLTPTTAFRAFWHYSPIWVDLGGNGNHWGIPRFNSQGSIRIGSGLMTHFIDDDQSDLATKQSELKDSYRSLIFDFDSYEFTNFKSIEYQGMASGQMRLVRTGQVLGYLADSGHGFKFAAQNAQYVVEAFENEGFGIAARKVAGVQ